MNNTIMNIFQVDATAKHLLITVLLVLVPVAGWASPALPDPLQAGWEGEPVCQKLHEDPDQRILRCTFPPGGGHERHFHAPHFGYAISGGRMRITDDSGTREVDLQEGTSFVSDGTPWHEVVNVGNTTCIYLIVESKQEQAAVGAAN